MSDNGEDEVTIKKRKICIPSDDEAPKKQRLDEDGKDGDATTSGVVAIRAPRRSVIDLTIANTLVDRRQFRRVGPYILGPKIGCSPVDSIVQYLAKKEGTNEFVQLKILMLSNESLSNEASVLEERQGKMLLHTEMSLLSMLVGHKGVIQTRGLLSDQAYEEDRFVKNPRASIYTGHIRRRLVLVLDCVTPHEFNPQSKSYINLQQYFMKAKKLHENEYVPIFREIVGVVEKCHERNIIHRDLKLGNIILNRFTNRVTLVNFCLGKFLLSDKDLLSDQRGSPAYISPEVLSGKPYLGKPIDVWALGVMLYMMVYGQFPFFESSPAMLFKKIKSGDFEFPMDVDVSFETQDLIREMLEVDYKKRLTAEQVRITLDYMLATKKRNLCSSQSVPNMTPEASGDKSKSKSQSSVTAYIRQRERNTSHDQLVPEFIESPKPTVVQACRIARMLERKKLQPPRVRHAEFFPNGPLRSRDYEVHPFIIYPTTPPHESAAHDANIDPSFVPPAPVYDYNIDPNFLPPPPEPTSQHVVQQMQNLSLRRDNAWSFYRRHRLRLIQEPEPLRVFDPSEEPRFRRRQPSPTNTFQPIDPSATSTVPLVRPAPSNPRNHLQSLFTSINEMFTHGRLTPLDDGSMRFNGMVTTEFAERLTLWLVMEHGEHYEIKRIFRNSLESPMEKVLAFFQRCAVRMSSANGQHRVRRQQNLDLMVVLTYLLMACGYDNSYFMSPSERTDRPV